QLAVCNAFTCGGIVSTTVTVTATAGPPPLSLRASPGTSVVLNSSVTLIATVTGGTGASTVTFKQTGGPAQTFTASTATTRTFLATLPVGTTTATLTFSATATDAAGHATTTTIILLVGPDHFTVVTITYSLVKSILAATIIDSVPGGKAAILATPLDALGKPIAAAIAMTYDPTLNTYDLPALFTVNPIPNA